MREYTEAMIDAFNDASDHHEHATEAGMSASLKAVREIDAKIVREVRVDNDHSGVTAGEAIDVICAALGIPQ